MATTPTTPNPETISPQPVINEPQVPEGFNKYEKRSDGSYYAQLGDGTEFTGANEFELVGKIGKAKVDTAEWAKSIKSQIPEPVVAQPSLTEEQRREGELQAYLADQQAKYLGLSGAEELKQVTQNLVKNSQAYDSQQQQLEFHRRCPDFPNSPENADKLAAILQERVGWQPGRVPTADQLQLAHYYATSTGVYKAMTQDEINASRGVTTQTHTTPNPVPSIRGNQPELVTNSNDAWSMPLKDLEAQVNAGIRNAGGLMNAMKPNV